jgi:hypothetical protein
MEDTPIMRHYYMLLLLTVSFLPFHASAQEPVCPCDIATLENGLTGSDIIDLLCPGGSLGSDSEFFLSPTAVLISLDGPPNTDYEVEEVNEGVFFCAINTDGAQPVPLQLLPEDYFRCRQQLIDRCNLLARNIPTLSEWGLIATAGILGIAGLIAVRRRKAAA